MKITKKALNKIKANAYETFVAENGYPFHGDFGYIVEITEGEKVEIATFEFLSLINHNKLQNMGFSDNCKVEIFGRINRQRKIIEFPVIRTHKDGHGSETWGL